MTQINAEYKCSGEGLTLGSSNVEMKKASWCQWLTGRSVKITVGGQGTPCQSFCIATSSFNEFVATCNGTPPPKSWARYFFTNSWDYGKTINKAISAFNTDNVKATRSVSVHKGISVEATCVVNSEKAWTTKVCDEVKVYFLDPYKEGYFGDVAKRWIDGNKYVVQRYNHGLAHGLRQGALAVDIVELLSQLKTENKAISETVSWVKKKISEDSQFLSKVEMASSFQRSGRESEGSSSSMPEAYKRYELQDSINFSKAALKSSIFENGKGILIFAESILWSNDGTLFEHEEEDLKFLKRILHAAHTFDLRRLCFFDGDRIQKDALEQLFGKAMDPSDPLVSKITEALWSRSGAYLEKTGDSDLSSGRGLQDEFFIQSREPEKMIDAVYEVRKDKIRVIPSSLTIRADK